MISQSRVYLEDEQWLKYADYAERHFINPAMTPGEQAAMRAGLALGYDAGRRGLM
jgi:hypothetical protein